ncbi:MAG: lolA [Burkholderiaceae bacterium]|nr:lolA [Burkholderiaceae bacterium]
MLNRLGARCALLAAITMSALLPALAQAGAVEQFKTFIASTRSAKGEFSQHLVKMADGKASVAKRSSGSFVFARPGKFIWTYHKPYEQVIQADGKDVFIYDKDLNQVTVRKLGNALGSSPAAILFGSNRVEQNFTLKEAGTKQGIEWLEAVPKAKDTTFRQIGIGMKNGVPVAMELHDSFGQVSALTFHKFDRNPPVSSSQFKFVMPKGADVYRQ